MKSLLPVCALAMLSACTVLPTHEMRSGAIEPTTSQRVVLLPATCASVKDACRDEFTEGTQGLVEQELEFAGYSIVPATRLVMDARSREDANAELRVFGEKVASAKTRAQRGSIFDDLSPTARRALVQEARAQGIMTVRVSISPHDATWEDVVEVTVRYGVGEDGAKLGWVSRCKYTPETFGTASSNASKVEQTTRCALKKALGR